MLHNILAHFAATFPLLIHDHMTIDCGVSGPCISVMTPIVVSVQRATPSRAEIIEGRE